MKAKNIKIIIIFIIALISIILLVFLPNKENVIENNNVYNSGDVEESINNNKEFKNVAILGMRNITMKANTKDINVNFINPIENEGLYYQTFELRLLNDSEEGYEILYQSDMVKPGEEIKEITLSREIEKGEYDAIYYVQPYRMDVEKTPTNDAKIKIKIIAK